MLNLERNQLAEISRRRGARFSERLAAYLTDTYAERVQALPAGMLEAFVEQITGLARKWQFRTESEIAELAMLVLEMRLAFGTRATPEWFAAIVQDASLNPQAKLYHLLRRWRSELDQAFGHTPWDQVSRDRA